MGPYPRLGVTAAQLVLVAHVMISTTAVKHHKYSLETNVQSDPGRVNGKWGANDNCEDCVTSSMSEAQINAKKISCGKKNLTPSLVGHDECTNVPGCMIWDCLHLNCDQFKFDPKNPIICEDCATEPTITYDCGCKKWTCEKRRCVGEEYEKKKCPKCRNAWCP